MATDELEFEWDAEKARSNLAKHGVSFHKAGLIFRNDILEFVDDREDYNEIRYIAFGRVQTEIYTVVYTRPGESSIRLISAWRASVEDEEFYYREIFSFRA